MINYTLHQNSQLPLLRRDLVRVIPLQIVRDAVRDVDRFSEEVVPCVENTVFDFEFVGEDELVGLVVKTSADFGRRAMLISSCVGKLRG
jgi:hypothetical protein